MSSLPLKNRAVETAGSSVKKKREIGVKQAQKAAYRGANTTLTEGLRPLFNNAIRRSTTFVIYAKKSAVHHFA